MAFPDTLSYNSAYFKIRLFFNWHSLCERHLVYDIIAFYGLKKVPYRKKLRLSKKMACNLSFQLCIQFKKSFPDVTFIPNFYITASADDSTLCRELI